MVTEQDGQASAIRELRWWEILGFIVLALLPAAPRVLALDSFPRVHLEQYYAAAQLPDLLDDHHFNLSQMYTGRIDLQEGSSVNGGRSLTWAAMLHPFLSLIGSGPRAFNLATLACHLLFSILLWGLSRRCYPHRSPLILALIFFPQPWYQSAIFCPTFLSVSTFVSMLALFLLVSAQGAEPGRKKGILFLLAGVALGLNLYSFVVHRVYTVISLLLVVGAAVMAGWRLGRWSWPDWAAVSKKTLLLLLLGFFLTSSAAMINIGQSASLLFFDQEMITGFMYKLDVEAGGGYLKVMTKTVTEFFTMSTARQYRSELDILILGLVALGLWRLRRTRPVASIVAAAWGVSAAAAICLFTNAVTHTRMAALCLPLLLLAGDGLEAIWEQRRRLPILLRGAVAALFAYAIVVSNIDAWEMFYNEDPINVAARVLVKRGKPVRYLVELDMEDESHRKGLVVKQLLMSKRVNESMGEVQIYYGANRAREAAATLAANKEQVVVLWYGSGPRPAIQGLKLRPLGRFDDLLEVLVPASP